MNLVCIKPLFSQAKPDVFLTNEMLTDPKQKIVYLGLPNNIKIHGIENMPGRKVIISQFYKVENIDYQTFTVYPNWKKTIFLTVKDTILNKVIFTDSLKTISYPDPYPVVNGKKKGKITKEELQKVTKIDLICEKGLWKEDVFVVKSFVLMSTNDTIALPSKSQYLTVEQKKFLVSLPSKNNIYFTDMIAEVCYSHERRDISTIMLEIE